VAAGSCRHHGLHQTTDNDPVEYRYVSKRLVTEIVQQHAAARRRRSWAVSVSTKLVGISVASKHPDGNDYFDLALRAEEAVEEDTGTLEQPCRYIKTDTVCSAA